MWSFESWLRKSFMQLELNAVGRNWIYIHRGAINSDIPRSGRMSDTEFSVEGGLSQDSVISGSSCHLSQDSTLSSQSLDITSELLQTDGSNPKKKKTGVKKSTKKKKSKTEDCDSGEKVKRKKDKSKSSKKKSSERPEPEGGNTPVTHSLDDFERVIYSNEPLFSDLELSDEDSELTKRPTRPQRSSSRPGGIMFPCISLGLMGMQSNTMIKFAIIGTEIQNVLQVSLRRVGNTVYCL